MLAKLRSKSKLVAFVLRLIVLVGEAKARKLIAPVNPVVPGGNTG